MLSAADATPGIPAARACMSTDSQSMTVNHPQPDWFPAMLLGWITHYHPVTHRARAGVNSTHLHPGCYAYVKASTCKGTKGPRSEPAFLNYDSRGRYKEHLGWNKPVISVDNTCPARSKNVRVLLDVVAHALNQVVGRQRGRPTSVSSRLTWLT